MPRRDWRPLRSNEHNVSSRHMAVTSRWRYLSLSNDLWGILLASELHQTLPVYVVDDDDECAIHWCSYRKSMTLRCQPIKMAWVFWCRWFKCGWVCGALFELAECLRWEGSKYMNWCWKHRARFRLVYLTGHGDVPMAVEALQAGAALLPETCQRRRVSWGDQGNSCIRKAFANERLPSSLRLVNRAWDRYP